MSTTLSTHPPQPAVPQSETVTASVVRPTSRPNAVDRLALRLGLLLITYGRRRYAQPARARRPRVAGTGIDLRDRAWDSSGWLPRPGA